MPWYLNKKQNEQYANLSADYSELNSNITVKSGIVKETETEWVVYGIFSTVTSIRSKDMSFFFSEQACKFTIHKSDWEKPTDWNSEQRKFMSTKTVKHSAIEGIYCILFDSIPEFKTGFSGILHFNSGWGDNMIECLATGYQNGKQLSADTLAYLRSTIYEITTCDISNLPAIETATKAFSGSSKQSEKQRLSDRLEFVTSTLFISDNKPSNLHELVTQYIGLFNGDTDSDELRIKTTEFFLKLIMN